jgi:hypothetical protein
MYLLVIQVQCLVLIPPNNTPSIIDPTVVQAIIDKTGDTWQCFPLLFAICLTTSLITWLAVDLRKGRQDVMRWAVEQRGTMDGMHSGGKGKASGGILSVGSKASL